MCGRSPESGAGMGRKKTRTVRGLGTPQGKQSRLNQPLTSAACTRQLVRPVRVSAES